MANTPMINCPVVAKIPCPGCKYNDYDNDKCNTCSIYSNFKPRDKK